MELCSLVGAYRNLCRVSGCDLLWQNTMVMVRAVRSRRQATARITHITILQEKFRMFSLLVSAGMKEREERGKVQLRAGLWQLCQRHGEVLQHRDPCGSEGGWR